ncbi:hypothetical protein FDP41_002344 [Naegleria fowleri]|uniref:Thymidylate kinase n=1 Tax=Naegleria fowleri TaxID=5763 RepID=A0A6A5BW57_NAEFO|nr:uncharacterized protein FDP41_002344 [Naegleria fowleri]KAF0978524.1 hypothetical protein FDP41_002344 [Naegleria fowleri]CAG4715004.1 unnamed protein product [Naegleria fowleri]
MAQARGAFIVFEGLDRCGKTTQTNLLLNFLKSKYPQVHETAFPDRSTDIGKLCDAYLRNKNNMNDNAIHLLFSANRWDKMAWIEKTLLSGEHIVCGRYAYSGVAYSAAKGMDRRWCQAPDVGLIEPDLVIYLKVDASVASSRKEYGMERYEKEKFQQLVKDQFEVLFENDKKVKVIDATKSIEEIAQEIALISEQVIEKVKYEPLDKLWTSN